MAPRCQNCEVVARHKYWNELPPIKRSFLKHMCGHFDLEMAIPKEFMECFQGELPDWCILQAPSGNGWRVRVRRNQSSMFFSDGWPNFVRDHGIMLGDSCVFSYLGTSTFEVLIFKECGSEREGPHFTHNSSSFPSPIICSSFLRIQQSNIYEDVPDEEDLEDQSKASGWFEEEQCSEENADSFSLDFIGKYQKTFKGKTPKSTEEESENEDYNEDEKFFKKRGRPPSQGAKQRQTVHISRRRLVTKEEIEAAYKEATNYMINNVSDIPRTQITMLRTHVYQGFHMTLKKDWALSHMCLEDHDVKLRVPGVEGSWIIGCRWTRKLIQCQLRVRWPSFVLDNNLEEHDVCIFELIRKGNPRSKIKAILDVHIFRVVDEVVPLKKVRTVV